MSRISTEALNKMSDTQLLMQIVAERKNALSNPYTALYERLDRIYQMLSRQVEREQKK